VVLAEKGTEEDGVMSRPFSARGYNTKAIQRKRNKEKEMKK